MQLFKENKYVAFLIIRTGAMVEYCSSGEDVSVNTVIIPRNWGAIWASSVASLRTDTSSPELLYSHC